MYKEKFDKDGSKGTFDASELAEQFADLVWSDPENE
jgi:hypothetical protein